MSMNYIQAAIDSLEEREIELKDAIDERNRQRLNAAQKQKDLEAELADIRLQQKILKPLIEEPKRR